MLMANLFSSGAPNILFFSQSVMILLIIWSANGNSSAVTSRVSSKFNLLKDDSGQTEQGAHYIYYFSQYSVAYNMEIFIERLQSIIL